MLDAIEKLLILQDRDRRITKLREELAHIPYERESIQAKLDAARKSLDQARFLVQKTESERKKLELEVQAKKQLIEKYSLQQFQTKKNEEYRALASEIETCKREISGIEDRELELMEQAEHAEKGVQAAKASEAEARRIAEARLADLAAREQSLKQDLTQVDANREQLAAAVDESLRSRYERLVKNKGTKVVVGIQHGVCGGCHMQLSRQTLVTCQAEQEIVACINCGRILYYTPDMDLAVAE